MTGHHQRPADPLPSGRSIVVVGILGVALALAGGVPLAAGESSRPTPPASPLGNAIGQALMVGGDRG